MIVGPISPAAEFQLLIVLFVIPLAVLIAGFILFYFKPKHRRIIGTILIALAFVELLFYSMSYPYIAGFSYLFAIITILLGFVSVLYSIKFFKN